ncbi:hypothetical protein KDN24_19195 [Bacillus sp. Bva_UNVM-123]|uniref:hypothetical protein n=1 Tax=Bacillus sp. Bva_UNVM-123 TaxID=2829798 RepID=UPI00391F1753
MYKGLIMNDSNTIIRVLDNIQEIDETEKHILFGDNGKLGGIDLACLNLVVTDDKSELKIGDSLPLDIRDKRDELVKNTSDKIKTLEKENNVLKEKATEMQFENASLLMDLALVKDRNNSLEVEFSTLLMQLAMKGAI